VEAPVEPRDQGAAAALRAEFDHSFAALPATPAPTEELLAIRVGGDSYALRLRGVLELVAGHPVSRLPSATPHLLGLAGLRGGVVPVFSLTSLLGAAGGLPRETPRWLLLCAEEEPFALAFDGFEGHLRLPTGALSCSAPGSARRFTSGLARTAGGGRAPVDRALLDLPLIAAALRTRAAPAPRAKEQ
jgi:purine-binding chemotaxis protein CheW